MKKLNKVYNLTLKDYKKIYEDLGFKANIVTEKGIECVLLLDEDNTPLYLVYVNTSSYPLNYDEVKNVLIDLELEFRNYSCTNYILISEQGYLNKSAFIKDEKVNVYDIQTLNIRLEDSEYVNELIKASTSNIKHFELNAHNKVAYSNIKEGFANGNKRVYVKHATGTGKSILVSKYILNECSGNVILLSSSSSILNQFSEHLSSFNSGKLNLITYNKLSQMKDDEFECLKSLNPELIVLDEFHRCGAKTWGSSVNELLKVCSNSRVLGTTATPVRYLDNARDMGDEIFDRNIVSDIDLCEAIVRGIIPMPTYVIAMYEFNECLEELRDKLSLSKCSQVEKAKALKMIEALNDIDKSSILIKDTFNKHIGDKRNFVVFCKNLEHMKSAKNTVSQWFIDYAKDHGLKSNINTYELYCSNPNNADVIGEFKDRIENNYNNDFNILFSIEMANEGIHSKYIDGVILLRPTKSPIIYYQQIGRALHVNPINKPIIFDFVNNSDYIQAQNFISGIQDSYNRVNTATNSTLSEIREVDILLRNIYDETKDIVAMLNDIEDIIKVDWDTMFDELVKFKNRRGTTIVRKSDNPKLYKWVLKNRYLYLKGMLSIEKKEKLDSIGFIASVQEALWFENYECLKDYKAVYNHINVSSEHNLKLYRFVKAQRRAYEKGILSKERIALLEELGMVWNTKHHKWETKFSELIDIYNQLGTLYVIENNPVVTANGITLTIDEELMHWIKCQRTYYTNGALSQDKIDRLESLGLALNLATKTWNDNMKALKHYVKVNGHANVQPKDDEKLYNWVRRLRRDKSRDLLDENIVKELESIGFTWSRRDTMWEEKFNKYLAYIIKYNTVIMEKGCEGYDYEIDRWIGNQRRLYNNGELSEDRIEKLNAVGFVWDVYEYKWMLIYEELKNFMHSLGETLYKSSLLKQYKGNTPLNRWVETQKRAFKANRLSENRLNLLLEIGVNFE